MRELAGVMEPDEADSIRALALGCELSARAAGMGSGVVDKLCESRGDGPRLMGSEPNKSGGSAWCDCELLELLVAAEPSSDAERRSIADRGGFKLLPLFPLVRFTCFPDADAEVGCSLSSSSSSSNALLE